jgi:hypothetical protein
MRSREERESENRASAEKNLKLREGRSAERAVKDRRKDLLQGASSTQERRQIKAGIYDLDTTRTDENKQGTDERVANDGIDRVGNQSTPTSSGEGLPDGYVETDFIMCVNGSPVSGKILFKAD